MTPNGRRAWRRAAKKLRCKMGRRWRSQEEWVHGKSWFKLVPDLAAHRGHISGPWFKRHGFQSLDPESSSRHYIGLWGTVDGDTIGFVEAARPFTARSLVGISQSARKHTIRALFVELVFTSQGTAIEPTDKGSRWFHLWCRGSGDAASRDPEYAALRAKYRIGESLRPCLGCSWCGTDPGDRKDGRWTECDGSGVLPARKAKR